MWNCRWCFAEMGSDAFRFCGNCGREFGSMPAPASFTDLEQAINELKMAKVQLDKEREEINNMERSLVIQKEEYRTLLDSSANISAELAQEKGKANMYQERWHKAQGRVDEFEGALGKLRELMGAEKAHE